jgi:type II secretory pathway pseudopilin PulG
MKGFIFKDRKGAALVIALIILLVLTLIGISAISTTTYETSISGNERVATNAFYAAEAGVQVGFNKLIDPVNKLIDLSPIPVTSLGADSSYWSGGPTDKGNPKKLQYLGEFRDSSDVYELRGSPTSYDGTPGFFSRYQVNATGGSFGATKEVEIQVKCGPY